MIFKVLCSLHLFKYFVSSFVYWYKFLVVFARLSLCSKKLRMGYTKSRSLCYLFVVIIYGILCVKVALFLNIKPISWPVFACAAAPAPCLVLSVQYKGNLVVWIFLSGLKGLIDQWWYRVVSLGLGIWETLLLAQELLILDFCCFKFSWGCLLNLLVLNQYGNF